MDLNACYPVLCCADLERARDFWVGWFGFSPTFAADWYVSLRREVDGRELALLDHSHPTLPQAYRGMAAQGVLINLEVEDVDAEWERLVVRGGLTPALELRSEEFGQRHFILAAPDAVLVDVITEIPPSEAFAAAFL